jgi:hypothetical protein
MRSEFRDRIASIEKWYLEKNVEDNLRIIAVVEDKVQHRLILVMQMLTDGVSIYDCCLEFDTSSRYRARGIDYVPVKGVYSNMPSFTYFYTYPLNKKGMIIKELKHKCSSKALRLPPRRNNPNMDIGVDKSLYSTAKFLSDTYGELTFDKLLKKKEFYTVMTDFESLEMLVSTQDEMAIMREMDKKNAHGMVQQNVYSSYLVSPTEGAVKRTDYKSGLVHKKSGKIASDIREKSVLNSGKTVKVKTSPKFGTVVKEKKLKKKTKKKVMPKGRRTSSR